MPQSIYERRKTNKKSQKKSKRLQAQQEKFQKLLAEYSTQTKEHEHDHAHHHHQDEEAIGHVSNETNEVESQPQEITAESTTSTHNE